MIVYNANKQTFVQDVRSGVIATGNEDGSITTYWDKVYKPE